MKSPTKTRRSTRQTRVLCVDDNTDMTCMMKMLLDADAQMRCVGCLGSADKLLKEVAALDPPPDVVLLDAVMPGKDPLMVMKQMATAFPAVRTIVFSGHDDPAFVARVKDSGAWGCVSKCDEPDSVLEAVRQVAAGNPWFRHHGH